MEYRIPDPYEDHKLQVGDIVEHENGCTYIVCTEQKEDDPENIIGKILCNLDQSTKEGKIDHLLDLIGENGEHVDAVKLILQELIANRL